MGTMDTQTTMDTLIMEDIPITEVIQVTMLIVGNCNPSLVEVEHLGLMMTAILPSPLKGDKDFCVKDLQLFVYAGRASILIFWGVEAISVLSGMKFDYTTNLRICDTRETSMSEKYTT